MAVLEPVRDALETLEARSLGFSAVGVLDPMALI